MSYNKIDTTTSFAPASHAQPSKLRIVAKAFSRALKNAFCWAFGHKVTWFESGYEVCDRCHRHGYHSEDYHKAGALRLDWMIASRISQFIRSRNHRKQMRAIEAGEDIPF